MGHLHPFNLNVNVAGRKIEIEVSFGLHVFTDEKETGPLIIHRGERRYFSTSRYNDSFQLGAFLQQRFAEGHARVYRHRTGGQKYFVFDVNDYAIFMTIRKPMNTSNLLKLLIVSAYTVDPWGRTSLPSRAKLHRMAYVLDMREQGKQINT